MDKKDFIVAFISSEKQEIEVFRILQVRERDLIGLLKEYADLFDMKFPGTAYFEAGGIDAEILRGKEKEETADFIFDTDSAAFYDKDGKTIYQAAIGDERLYERERYTYEECVPVTQEEALKIFEEEIPVLLLEKDNRERKAESAEEIQAHKRGFLVRKELWENYQGYLENEKRLDEWSEQENRLLFGKEDSYALYQVCPEKEFHSLRFINYHTLRKAGEEVKKENYRLVYGGELKPHTELGGLFVELSLNRPADFYGHSPSLSDIFVLRRAGKSQAFYLDTLGYREVPEFLSEEKEMAFQFPAGYLYIQESEEGYDYTLYDKSMEELDGGQLDNEEITIEEAAEEVTEDYGWSYAEGNRVPLVTFESRMEIQQAKNEAALFHIQLEEGQKDKRRSDQQRTEHRGIDSWSDVSKRREQNPLIKVEELIEQNYNALDGLINNREDTTPGGQRPPQSIHEKIQSGKERSEKHSQTNISKDINRGEKKPERER